MVLDVPKNHLCGDLLEAEFWDPPQRFQLIGIYISVSALGDIIL